MITQRVIHNRSKLTQATPKVILLLILFATSLFAYSQSHQPRQGMERYAFLFQSKPQSTPTPTKSDTWIVANKGGSRQSGTVRITLPAGFTKQSGASASVNMIIGSSSLHKSANVLPGTEFTVGIWPPNDQVQYQQPIEIRILINTAQVSFNELQNLVLLMYNPETKLWEEQASQFELATSELVTRVQRFKPVAKDFSEWGGRTFFCVAKRSLNAPTTSTGATVNHGANLRAGPGINYAKVGSAARGESLQLVGRTANGDWYQLNTGAWIAASLVSNAPALPVVEPTTAPTTPSPTSTPRPTPA